MTPQVYVTPLVRKLAAQHSVELDTVTGTGVAGRVTPADVRAAAVARKAEPAARELAQSCGIPDDKVLALVGSGPDGKISRADVRAYLARKAATDLQPPRTGAGATDSGPYAVNPLVAKAHTERPMAHRAASEEGPAPTLFASGDLPVYLVSGAEPTLLLKLPWQVRHAAARASSAELADLFESYSGPDGALNAELDYAGHPENRLYEQRVQKWLAGPDHWADPYAPQSAARQAADAENYNLLYGEDDRRKAEAKADAEQEQAIRERRLVEDRIRNQARAQRR